MRCVLLVAEGDEGVDAHGAERGDEAGDERDGHEQEGDAGKGERVGAGYAHKLAAQEARESESAAEADEDAERGQKHSAAEDHAQHVLLACAERHADADFMRALARGVGGDAVDSHGRENQREQTERADKCSGNALREAGDFLARFQSGDVVDDKIGVRS